MKEIRNKNRIYYFFIILFSSCVGSDTAFLPHSIKQAKEENLLFDIYQPDKKIVLVNDSEYIIDETFTSTKFNSTKDKTINKNVFMFIIKLKNAKTGEEFEYDFKQDWKDFINFNSEFGGIHDSNLSIDYGDLKDRNKLDTIKIGFINDKKIENTVTFFKIK